LHYGIDLSTFSSPIDPVQIRQALNIPPKAFVIGHVGRFVEQKNHDFLIDVFAEVCRLDSRAILLLVGEGPLRPNIEAKIQQLGLVDKVIFAGVRSDIPLLMRGAMDVFVFPSLYEGLGLVLVEAQAAALPAVAADQVPNDAIVTRDLVRLLSLESPSEWARIVVSWANRPRDEQVRLREVANSRFNVEASARQLCELYADVSRSG
jgi:glycosyltransferase involved in cell wall biosynthesis